MNSVKLITLLTVIVLAVSISGCVNPQVDITRTHTATPEVTNDTNTETVTTTPQPSGELKLTSYRVIQDNDLPFRAQVLRMVKGGQTVSLFIRITPTSHYNPEKEYYIDFITSFDDEVLRIAHYTDNLKQTRTYNCENGWCEGVEFKYTGNGGVTVIVVVANKDSNILYSHLKYYDTVKIGYFVKNSEYSQIFLGRSTVQFIYS